MRKELTKIGNYEIVIDTQDDQYLIRDEDRNVLHQFDDFASAKKKAEKMKDKREVIKRKSALLGYRDEYYEECKITSFDDSYRKWGNRCTIARISFVDEKGKVIRRTLELGTRSWDDRVLKRTTKNKTDIKKIQQLEKDIKKWLEAKEKLENNLECFKPSELRKHFEAKE